MSKSHWGVLFCVGAGLAAGCGGSPARPIGGCDVQLAPQVCAPALCGNDERDLCGPTPPTFGCSDPTIFEPCDRLDLGGLTCASVGFGFGALACLSDCHGFDTSRCTSCVPGGSVERCGQVVPSTTNVPFAADIAATDADVAMAWIEEANGQVTLRFARLDANLDVVLEESLAEPALDASPLWSTRPRAGRDRNAPLWLGHRGVDGARALPPRPRHCRPRGFARNMVAPPVLEEQGTSATRSSVWPRGRAAARCGSGRPMRLRRRRSSPTTERQSLRWWISRR